MSPETKPAPVEEPRTYPLVLRTARYGWWQPVTGIVVALITYALLAPAVGQALISAVVALDHEGPFEDAFERTVTLDPVTWQGLLYLNLVLGSLIVASWGIVRYIHGVSGKWVTSVFPGIRWRFFWVCFGLAVVAIGCQLLLGVILGGDANSLGGSLNTATKSLVAMGIVVLLTTPLQAMGEEYFFRGYLMQAFGALARNPWVAIVVTSLLFALAHADQNAPLFLDRFAFGLMAGYVMLRTGGLEAGIAIHIWNNLFAFGLALGLGDIDETLHISETSWSNLPLTVTQNGVFLVLVLVAARRMGITSRTREPVLLPGSAPV